MQYDLPQGLPQPDAPSTEHSAKVAAHIRHKIAQSGGAISFAEYMHEALYAPGLGYYNAGTTKFGPAGDFVTAPEVSSVFGRILARQIVPILDAVGGGAILEFGAGSGKLAIDLLTQLEEIDALPGDYCILEGSPQLREVQRQRIGAALPHLADRVVWLDGIPDEFTGVYVANEVLDALPVESVAFGDAPQQRTVCLDGDRFVWGQRQAPGYLQTAVEALLEELGQPFTAGYVSELGVAAKNWLESVCGSLSRGAIFLFDYGVSRHDYYAHDRDEGWLRCHYRHNAHSDPLILPGIQDITAWVDFTAVAEAGVAAGLDILGYQSQAQFLMGGGLEQEMQNFAKLSTRQQMQLSAEIKTLTLPGEMGENFKCMALARGEVNPPSAFQIADRTRTL